MSTACTLLKAQALLQNGQIAHRRNDIFFVIDLRLWPEMDWRGPVEHVLQTSQSSVLFIIFLILRLRASHDLEPLVDGVVD